MRTHVVAIVLAAIAGLVVLALVGLALTVGALFMRLNVNESVFHFLSGSPHAVCLLLAGRRRCLDGKTKVNRRLRSC